MQQQQLLHSGGFFILSVMAAYESGKTAFPRRLPHDGSARIRLLQAAEVPRCVKMHCRAIAVQGYGGTVI
jgi:hypothetical protein